MSHNAGLFLLIIAPALAMVLALLGLETSKENFLGWLGFAIGVGYPPGAILRFLLHKDSFWQDRVGRMATVEESSDRSFWLILPGLLVIFFAPPLEYIYLPEYLSRADWMQWAGTAFVCPGAALLIWSQVSRRRWHSIHGHGIAGRHLIKNGPYRHLRHPVYTGYLLIALGYCLGFSSVIGLAALPVLFLPGIAYRMNVEEKLSIRSFGEEYRAYMRRTKLLIPGLW